LCFGTFGVLKCLKKALFLVPQQVLIPISQTSSCITRNDPVSFYRSVRHKATPDNLTYIEKLYAMTRGQKCVSTEQPSSLYFQGANLYIFGTSKSLLNRRRWRRCVRSDESPQTFFQTTFTSRRDESRQFRLSSLHLPNFNNH
jgi:hypothetical protein